MSIRLFCHSERPRGAKNLGFLFAQGKILRRFAPQNDHVSLWYQEIFRKVFSAFTKFFWGCADVETINVLAVFSILAKPPVGLAMHAPA
jgi:hypothetical protein